MYYNATELPETFLHPSVINGCKNPSQPAARNMHEPNVQDRILAIKNVNIIPMTLGNRLIEDATIVIRGNKILSINEFVPNSAETVDGKGRWLIPGLIDMHVHTPTDGHFNTTYPTRAAAIFNTQMS